MAAIDEVRLAIAGIIGGPDASIAFRREQSRAFADAAVTPAGVDIRPAEIAGIAVEWIEPRGAPAWPAFVHLHGGGYVMGDPAGSRAFTGELAVRAGVRVVSVDYALAPDHRYPRAVEDCVAVYAGILAQGAAPMALAIGGESAGGGLAMAALLAAKDAALPMPACAVVMSPWANLVCDNQSYLTKARTDPMLTRAILREMAGLYLGGADARDRLASPGLADLTGLPPMLIQAGGEEVLLGDANELARAAHRAGVDARLEIWDDMIHVWHMFHAMLPQGDAAIDQVVAHLEAHWRRGPGHDVCRA